MIIDIIMIIILVNHFFLINFLDDYYYTKLIDKKIAQSISFY